MTPFFQLDTLSLLFVALIVLGSVPNLFYTAGYLPHIQRKTHFLVHYFAFIGAMIGVVTANTPMAFLFSWEVMSLASWQLILTEGKNRQEGLTTRKAARFYFFMTHFGFVFLLLFFLIASQSNLDLPFSEMALSIQAFPYAWLLFLFLALGLFSKAGVVPLHVWLPYAHPAAPSPVSALMSGVMLKVALYALFRFLFETLHPWPLAWGVTVLLLGSFSALVGVLYALTERDIKALLANSSIENIGIILMAFGMGMIFDTLSLPHLSSFAFIAALFHIFNHMSFKSLLFMGAGNILHQTHTKNMELFGGLIKSMPITAWTFLIAALSISALPPSNGFISEWMLFQSMMASQAFTDITLKLALPFAMFSLAMTSGLAIATFVKAFGITFLGLNRSENAAHAKEVNVLMMSGLLLMTGVLIGLMLWAPAFLKLLDGVVYSLNGQRIAADLVPTSFSIHAYNPGAVISPFWLLIGLIALTSLLVWVKSQLKLQTRRSHTWACGNRVQAVNQYTAAGFAAPLRRYFQSLYQAEERIESQAQSVHIEDPLPDDAPHFKKGQHHLIIHPLFERSLYHGTVQLLKRISFWIYHWTHYEKFRYTYFILVLLILVLLGYRLGVTD